MNFFKALILLFVMTSCTQKEKVDLIVSGGSVYTVDKEFTVAEAFAVKDGKVVAVGSSQKILDKYDSENLMMSKESLFTRDLTMRIVILTAMP